MAKARQKIFQSIGYRSRGRLIWIIFGICIYAICQEANEMQQSKDREDLKAECIMYSLANYHRFDKDHKTTCITNMTIAWHI